MQDAGGRMKKKQELELFFKKASDLKSGMAG
jgi:hypothetical protein